MHKFKVAQIPSRRDFKAKSLALEIKAVYIWFAEQQAVLGMTGLSFINAPSWLPQVCCCKLRLDLMQHYLIEKSHHWGHH